MAKKVSLRQFQEGLVARLKDVQSGTVAQSASKMGVQVGQEKWLINLPDVSEVVPLPQLLKVPLTQPWFSGMANVRGVLYSAVDFSRFLGGEPTQSNIDSRLLLANGKYHMNAGIIVHHMLGLKNPEQLQIGTTENLPPWVAAEYVDSQGEVWKELNMPGLIHHPDFLNVGV
jgi:twitching motility protein PilI